MSETTYYQINKNVIKKEQKIIMKMINKYIKIYIDIDIREQARYKLRKFSEEEKKENREYGRNKYHNMPELKEQKLKEYQKHYRQAKKLK